MNQHKYDSWHHTQMRWIFLFLTSIFQIACCTCIDFPSVLATEIQTTFLVGQRDINYLFSIYSLPNIILPFFGGIIIDRIGVRKALFIFCSFLVIGQALCVNAAYQLNFEKMKLGMLFLGFGGEVCLTVAQSALLTKWFLGQEMSLAFGVQLTFIRIGSVIGANWFPQIYIIYNSFTACMLVCFIFIVIAMITCIIQIYIDQLSDERDKLNLNQQQIETTDQQFNCNDVKEFKFDYHLLSISCVCSYGAFLVFQQNGFQFFKIRYNLQLNQQTFLYSLPYFISATVTPFIGYFIDKIGKRPLFLILSGILLFLSNLIYQINCVENCFNYILLAQLLNGIFFAIYAPVIWPCVPLCVPLKSQGTGFGIMTSIQNGGLSLLPMVVGRILFEETQQTYIYMIYFLGLIIVIGNISNCSLFIYDINHGKKLMLPSSEVQQYQEVTNLGGEDNSTEEL